MRKSLVLEKSLGINYLVFLISVSLFPRVWPLGVLLGPQLA